MIDFACKQFNLDDIIKCCLGLTRSEFVVMRYFLDNPEAEFNSNALSLKLNLGLTTLQKCLKKLSEKNIIIRRQKNLEGGGYTFCYSVNSKSEIRNILKSIMRNWSLKVEERINQW